MKITQIEIDGFGKWQATDFKLSPKLQVIYGANEAGKSTLTQFILSVLFGFANHSGKNKYLQYIPKDTASYGGVITFEHQGQEYRLKRTKGKKVSGKVEFSTTTGEKLTEAKLTQMMSPLNEELYRSLLSFSQNDLNAIFDLSKDEIDVTLQQMGTVGSDQWIKLVKGYEKTANSIYKDSGRVLPINVKLQEHQALKEQIDEAKLEYNRYHELVEANEEDNSRKVKLTKQLDDLRGQDNELAQLSRLMPIYQKLQGMNQTDKSDFSSDDEIKINQIVTKENELKQLIKRNEADLNVLNSQQFTSEKQQFYIEHLTDFETISRQIPRLRQAIESKQTIDSDLQIIKQENNAIKSKYQNKVPQPLHEDQKRELDGLLARKTELLDQQDTEIMTRSSQPAKPSETKQKPILFVGLAVVGIVIAILFTTLLMRIIGAVLLITGVIGWYLDYRKGNIVDEVKVNPVDKELAQVNLEINEFGQAHDLQNYSVNQWQAMQFELTKFTEQLKQIELLNEKLAEAELVIDNFIDENKQLSDWIDGDNLAVSLDKIEEYHEEQRNTVNLVKQNNEKRKLLTEQINEQQQRLTGIKSDKQLLLEKIGVASVEEFQVKYQNQLAELDANAEKKALSSQINDTQLAQLASYRTSEELDLKLQNIRNQVSEIKINRDEIEANIARQMIEINAIAKNGLLSELRQQLADLETEINELVAEWLQNQLAMSWINQTLKAASSDRLPQIINQAKQYFTMLTGERYIDIVLDDVIKVVDKKQVSFEVGELSKGTAEQLYVALRFGFITIMNQTINFPIIIDDGFVNFDNLRKNRTIELLKDLSKNNQVIYFTADDRIIRMYNDEQIINLDEDR